MPHNKHKILNDPVYGFISISDKLVFDIIEHQYFQRLRRIQQLGMTHYVYPGALHTRFHHAIGAMHLMREALKVISYKGTSISQSDIIGATIAILLHDIGHGPFSHALENSLIENISHEDISLAIMKQMNTEMSGQLDDAIDIFCGKHEKNFLYHLVSGQIDVDRLDYLTRDSFFTGVSEGVIGTERIIAMMNVSKNKLVIEEKGLFSVEKFLIARQLMYWQVYLHKTVISAETMLIKILRRAHFLAKEGKSVPCTPSLTPFLSDTISASEFVNSSELLHMFCQIDDFDIISSMKYWTEHEDSILSNLSLRLLNRKLFRTYFTEDPFSEDIIQSVKSCITKKFSLQKDETDFYFEYGFVETHAYDSKFEPVSVLYKDGSVSEVSQTSTVLNITDLLRNKKKYYLTFPKEATDDVFLLLKKLKHEN